MTLGSAITYASDADTERRARRLPWGIEIQTWRLVETQTYPNSVENLTLSTLLKDAEQGATPDAPSSGDDDVTLENPIIEILEDET
jgi:hypothetical protein